MNDQPKRLMPVLLVKPGTMSRRDITRSELGGICVVECSDPDAARFVEPPLAMIDLDAQARAALSLVRYILSKASADFQRGELTRVYVDAILNGPRPAPVPPATPVKK